MSLPDLGRAMIYDFLSDSWDGVVCQAGVKHIH